MASITGNKLRHNEHTLDLKYVALMEVDRGLSNKDVAKKSNVPKDTLSIWNKNREKIIAEFKSNGGTKTQRIKEGIYRQVNLVCYKWLLIQRSKNGTILQEKAFGFAKKLIIEKFQASDGFLHAWKTRHNTSFKEVIGESRSVTPEMTNAWNETFLPTILSRYKLKDIYNADEFSLFCQGVPKKTLHMKGEKCSDGKHNKIQLTGMAATSAAGEKLPKRRKPSLLLSIASEKLDEQFLFR